MELILKSLCIVVFLGSALYAHAATQGSEPNNENDEGPEPQIDESSTEGGDFGKKFFHRLRLQTDDSGSKKEYSPPVRKGISVGQSGAIGVGGDKSDSTERQKILRKKPGNPIEKINIDRISEQTGSIVSKKEYSPVIRKELPTTQSAGAQVGDNKEESTERQNYPASLQGKKPGLPIEKINIDRILNPQIGSIATKKEYSPVVRKELPTTQSAGAQVGDNKEESTERQTSQQGKKQGYPRDKLNIDRRSQQTDGSVSRKKYSREDLSTGQSGSSEVGGNKGESAQGQKPQGGQQEKKRSYRRGYKRPEERQESVEETTEHKEPESSSRRYSRKGHARNSNSERSTSS